MQILILKTFVQPDGTRITIRKLETPLYPPYSCERLVDEHCSEGYYGITQTQWERTAHLWGEFEHKIHSKEER